MRSSPTPATRWRPAPHRRAATPIRRSPAPPRQCSATPTPTPPRRATASGRGSAERGVGGRGRVLVAVPGRPGRCVPEPHLAMTADDLAAHARALLDANGYLTLGTVDPAGRPWTSPVYFAAAGLREFYWSSE